MLRNLEVSTAYEVRVAKRQADGSYGQYSSSALFQTLSAKAQQCVSEAVETTEQLASMSQEPLLLLQVGDRFQAGGGMEVTVVQASGSNGVFSGKGVVLIPWLGTRLEVTFQEVIINQDKQLVGGAVELRSDSEVKEFLAEIDKHNPKEKTPAPPPPPPVDREPVVVAGTIAEVAVDQDQQQVSVQLAGQAAPVTVSYAEGPVTIQDEAGNRYRVNEQGEVSSEAGALAGGGTETQTGTTTVSGDYDLMLALLDSLEVSINAWLAVEGKGPLDDNEMLALALPAGLPADAELLTYISEHTLAQVRADTRTFLEDITQRNTQIGKLLTQNQASLSKAELAQVKQAVALQLTFWGLISDLEDFLNGLGLKGACLYTGLQKGKDVFWQKIADFSVEHTIVLALNAGTVETLFCLSSRENCPGQDYWGQFGCGAVNALVEEIDLNGMVEAGMAAAKAYLENKVSCLKHGSSTLAVFTDGTTSEILKEFNKCFFGVNMGLEEAEQLYQAVQKYVVEHYNDPYDHGKATMFVLSIASPFSKVNKATKLNMLTKLEQLSSKADDVLVALKRGVEAEDVSEIRFALGAARGSLDGITTKTQKLLDEWPTDTYNKFQDEVVSTELWDEVFKNAADQEGLVKAWKALEKTSFRTDIKWLESLDAVKKNDLLKLVDEASEAEVAAIHRYTVNNFELTRGAYTRTLTPKQQEWIDLVNSGLDKLRPNRGFQGKVFRGTNRPESEIIEKYMNVYNEGVARGITPRVNEPPLLSTSKSTVVAEDFIQRFKSPNNAEVMFEITSRRGVDIDDISDYGKNLGPKNHPDRLVQEEVILSNNQDYEIVDVVKTTQNDGSVRYLIKLSE